MEKLVKYYDIQIEKVGETNWKSRERCLIQYCDQEAIVTKKLLDETYKINKIATAKARKYEFKASVFMSDRTIITILDDFRYIKLVNEV